MKILILGGDGYLGWPISLALANRGHEVTIMDNLAKRKWEMECGSTPLFEVLPIHRRTAAFQQTIGKEIRHFIGDITNVGAIYHIFDLVQPDIVIRSAGQPSAPFSMKSRMNAIITQENNYIGAMNLLFAVQRAERNIHIISLGSMGVYGAPGIAFGEGYLEIGVNGIKGNLPFPVQPESFLHLSEACASHAMLFACRNWGLCITELRLGIVYGFETPETALNPALATSFYCDAVFGTVANRFSVQATIGYPLTVFGSGQQKRTFLSLTDVIKGVELALKNPPEKSRLRIINHFSEIMSISELSERVLACANRCGLQGFVEHVPNHRIEIENIHYSPERKLLDGMGIKYSMLEDTLNEKFFMKILEAKDRVDLMVIDKYIPWRKH